MTPKDLGIVAAFSESTNNATINIQGATVADKVAGNNAYVIGQVSPGVGRGDRLVFAVHAAFVGGMATWTFYARANYADGNNAFWKPAEIAIQRIDGSDSPGVAKALVAVNFTGTNGSACDVAFVTTNDFAYNGALDIMVKGNQAAASGDLFRLAVMVGK